MMPKGGKPGNRSDKNVNERKNFHSSERVKSHALKACRTTFARYHFLIVRESSSLEPEVSFSRWVAWSTYQRALCWAAHTWSGSASLSLLKPSLPRVGQGSLFFLHYWVVASMVCTLRWPLATTDHFRSVASGGLDPPHHLKRFSLNKQWKRT